MAVQFSPGCVDASTGTIVTATAPSWLDRAGDVVASAVTSALIAVTDAIDDASYWIDRTVEKHAVSALDDLAPCRLLYATYGDVDVSALMQYYLKHDKYLSVGSMHRFMSRRGPSAPTQSMLAVLFVRDAVVYEARMLDAYELLTGAPVDQIELATLPGRPVERPDASAGLP